MTCQEGPESEKGTNYQRERGKKEKKEGERKEGKRKEGDSEGGRKEGRMMLLSEVKCETRCWERDWSIEKLI